MYGKLHYSIYFWIGAALSLDHCWIIVVPRAVGQARDSGAKGGSDNESRFRFEHCNRSRKPGFWLNHELRT